VDLRRITGLFSKKGWEYGPIWKICGRFIAQFDGSWDNRAESEKKWGIALSLFVTATGKEEREKQKGQKPPLSLLSPSSQFLQGCVCLAANHFLLKKL